MKIFIFGKKKTEGESRIKVLGSGCAKCSALEKSIKDALKQMKIDIDIEHVKDFDKIAQYGVISTPALVVDGIVQSYGKVLTKNEVIQILQECL